MSEQQSRIGTLIGNGLAFVTEKTALTRSQWLMLALFTTGAILVGFASTRQTYSPKTPPSSGRSVLAASTNAPVPSAPAKAPPAETVASDAPLPSTEGVPAANLAAATGPAGLIPARPEALEPTKTAPVPLASSGEAAQTRIQPTNSIDPGTKALFDNLAKDIARINQKLDDLAGRQRQTSTRLAALIADGKQGRARPADNEDADRPKPASHKTRPPLTPKVAKATPRDLTVHPKRVVQRARSDSLRQAVIEREFAARRRFEIAQQDRRIRRRRLASSLIFGPF